jgi:hypothetical protein
VPLRKHCNKNKIHKKRKIERKEKISRHVLEFVESKRINGEHETGVWAKERNEN